MELLILGIIIGWLLKPSKISTKYRGGVRSVPPANYTIDIKPPIHSGIGSNPPPKSPSPGLPGGSNKI